MYRLPYEAIKQHLLSAFNHCAPNGKAQSEMVNVLQTSEGKGDPSEISLLLLVDNIGNILMKRDMANN